MKPANGNVLASLDQDKDEREALAASQWKLIHAFERGYLGKQVPNTSSNYEAEEWFDLNGSSRSRTGIKWSKVSGGPALKILAKAMTWDFIFDRSLEISTASLRLLSFQKMLLPVIESKKLLAGNPGEVLLGLSHITDDDLLVILDQQMVSMPRESQFLMQCMDLNGFVAYARHYGERVPEYLIRAQLPWQKSGETITAWAKRRIADKKFIFPSTEGYEPISGETAQHLVEVSLSLIDKHFDDLCKIGPLVAEYTARTNDDQYVISLGERYILGILKKYSRIFGYIIPPPDLSKRSKLKDKGRAVFMWLQGLIKLCRAACINIILLTSGLRNEDIRKLKVGACSPSGRVDILFYLRVDIQKTGNVVILPLPSQADKAIRLLESMKDTKSNYLLDWGTGSRKGVELEDIDESEVYAIRDGDTYLKAGSSINDALCAFAEHFNIPLIDSKGNRYTAHNYRTTVAGWLGAASNLSLLLVRRLFGHSNNIMPTVYLHNNPAFIAERQAQKARANAETARQMALAASQGRVAGVKGEQLERGYQAHKSRMESNRSKSHSLTDAEIMISFGGILEQRINSDSVCGFLTPFGVMCARNPTDSSQPACAKRAHRDKTQGIPIEILKHVSDIDPQQCVGTSCSEAILGPWSTAVLETVIWYRALLRHQLGDAFNESHYIESAKLFIRQYEAPIRKVFGHQAVDDAQSNKEVVNG